MDFTDQLKSFLLDHDLILPGTIESRLNLPKGTIRLSSDRKIPDKYHQSIINLLYGYGLKGYKLEPDKPDTIPTSTDNTQHNVDIIPKSKPIEPTKKNTKFNLQSILNKEN